MNTFAETNRVSSELKTIHRWIRRKLGIMRNKSLTKYKISEVKTNDNKYSPKYVARLLAERYPTAKAVFYFVDRNDYITLSPNGHLNVRSGDEELFKAWGNSEFTDCNPGSVFKELEKELTKIVVVTPSAIEARYFNSYSEFINWLGKI
jgi:hypothetical protein